jgi:hypothetical protein
MCYLFSFVCIIEKIVNKYQQLFWNHHFCSKLQFLFNIVYNSGSQPFGLQVPVKDKFFIYCPSQQSFKVLCPRIMCFMGQKQQQIDTDFAWILVKILFLLTKLNNLGLFHCEISNY